MREKSFETVALGVAVDPGSAYHGYFLNWHVPKIYQPRQVLLLVY